MRVEFDQYATGRGGTVGEPTPGGGEPPAAAATEAHAGSERPAPRTRRARLTDRVPALVPAAAALHRLRRRAIWAASGTDWASRRTTADFPLRAKLHRTPRPRGSDDPGRPPARELESLRFAAQRLDGLVIAPGQEFSFWRSVEISSGGQGGADGSPDIDLAELVVGDGASQVANLVHWLVLHTPMVVTERSERFSGFFPDDDRGIPWGIGCAIYDDDVDFRCRNEGPVTYQLRLVVGDDGWLEGELRSDRAQEHSYKVFAVDDRYVPHGEQWSRTSELWRNVIDRLTGDQVRRELIKKDRVPVNDRPPRGVVPTRPEPGLGGSGVVQ